MKAEYPVALTIRMTPEQMTWLRTEAERREVFASEVARELIDNARK